MSETHERLDDLVAAWFQIFGEFDEESARLWSEHFPKAVISAPGNRLTAAFAELRQRGYFAEQNFGCCSRCSFAAIDKKKISRAVFYHEESFNDMLLNGEVYLNWRGDCEEIIALLRGHGLTVEWDGEPDTALLVKDLFEPESEELPSQDSVPGGLVQ